ncbi:MULTISPECIES: hypothetical protein [unclassified Staphylococcus]|uniref:hypothetical protein n=1 Tax=unclassified Staphylococcus TaxID=91994 RepID=UPI0021CEBB86|nr:MULTISPECIES: hypothetical protein [unclassified Staphylococcus]UXR69931.1 hypothetical protein MUA26_01935 [Staphylococcus sp. IVB6246]UXR74278.1 hypothetical protein MUA48_02085 [Staphylococcus sp. IVB6238]UXR76665.1 hypothetical protein MUA74_02450 [Staphylococcus sp. IVB6233]UXR80794.1 hypothetical protein MUA65_02065 [Staphylococcus sp. IVB6218]
MKTTNELMKENNVKSLRLNNTDRQIFESYMTYVRADMRVNAYDSEKVLQQILAHLLKAENKGMHAMDFFNHDPKQHANDTIKALPNHTFINICQYIYQHIIFLLGLFCFFKGFLGFFINDPRIFIYTFPLVLISGLLVIFLFVWFCFKMVQLQAFHYSRLAWLIGYLVLIALFILMFQIFFFPQQLFQFGPYILVGNWTFVLISFVILPIGLYLNSKQQTNNRASWR